MIEHVVAPQTAPFAVALGVMLLIALMEGVGLLFGIAFSSIVDALLPDFDVPDVDVDADIAAPDTAGPVAPDGGAVTQLLGWLCFGRVPALVLLVAFLTAFGLSGLVLQGALKSVAGIYMPGILAVVPAFAFALPATRYLGLGLSKVVPKEETEAVSRAGFVGKVAVVTRGTAKRGLPAEAKLRDRFGQTHYLLVEPDVDDEEIEAGSEVLLVRQTDGTFRAIRNTHAALSRQTG